VFSLAYFIIAGLLEYSLNWLSLIPWRRSAGAHWTERARALYPARAAIAWNTWLIPANCVLAGILCFPQSKPWWPLFAVAAWLGANLGNYPFNQEIFPWLKFKRWVQQVVAAWLMRFASWFVFGLALWAMPTEFGWKTLVIAGLAVFFRILMIWDLGLRMAHYAKILKPAPERLQRVVSETSQRMGISFRKVWLLDSDVSYAAAMPTTRELIFSKRILELHPDNEISAICAHEFAHLTESRSTLFRRIVGSFVFYPWIFLNPITNAFGATGVLLMFMAMCFFLAMNRGLFRRMEVRADKVANENQTEAGIYALALERVYGANQMPAVMPGTRKIHPHLYDRLLAAGITPSYPRPGIPDSTNLSLVANGMIFGILLSVTLGNIQSETGGSSQKNFSVRQINQCFASNHEFRLKNTDLTFYAVAPAPFVRDP
jgi:Zn-dependent protease with chaperone function